MAGTHEQARLSFRRGVLAERNRARLVDACQSAGVALGSFDGRVLAWLASYEPETCVVVAGLITRAYAAGRAAADTCRPVARRNGRRRSR